MNNLQKIGKEAKEAMGKAVDNTRRELNTIRGGKASPNLLDMIKVDAYGQQMSLTQVASVGTPEARLITVQPWDKGLIGAIEKAIQSSDLGLNPSNDGSLIRLPVPPLTEERRKELVKVIKRLAEEGRVAIRHARHAALGRVKKIEHVSDDEKSHEEKEIQSLHDDYIGEIEELIKAKEAEIMEV
ncbi:MAG: ribosome recycling factor [Gemmatimonadota bacterium]